MSIRFSDNVLNIEETGFVARDRLPRSLQLILIFLAVFDIICFSAYLTDDSSVNAIFLIVLICSMAALGSMTLFFVTRFRKVILATEFHNAMLASATQIGTRFCFITDDKGVIVYVDPGFQKMFANFMNQGERMLSVLAAFTEMSADVHEGILAALKAGKSGHVIWSFKDSAGEAVTTVTTIDAITRPKGYFIIRGRDYVQKRAIEKSSDEALKNAFLLTEQALDTIPGGIIIADDNGKVIHVNQPLEDWLGYAPGEIVQGKMQIKQIVYQYVGYEIGTMLLNDFSGDVILQRRGRPAMTIKMQQRLLMIDGKAAGIMGIVTL